MAPYPCTWLAKVATCYQSRSQSFREAVTSSMLALTHNWHALLLLLLLLLPLLLLIPPPLLIPLLHR